MRVTEDNMSKAELRKHLSEMRKGLSLEYRRKMDFEIESRLICSEEYSKADVIFTYISVNDEPDTRGIIHAAFVNGKAVAVPLCIEGNNMDFYLIKSTDDLVKGKYGLLEPDKTKCEKVEPTEKSLCIVPGLSFDAKGYRLGKGGGYYDRFLKDFKGTSAGLCYHSFFKLQLSAESFDIPVDIIVTENFIKRN